MLSETCLFVLIVHTFLDYYSSAASSSLCGHMVFTVYVVFIKGALNSVIKHCVIYSERIKSQHEVVTFAPETSVKSTARAARAR